MAPRGTRVPRSRTVGVARWGRRHPIRATDRMVMGHASTMGDEVAGRTFTGRTGRATGTRCTVAWTSWPRCSPRRASTPTAHDRDGGRAQPRRRRGQPALRNTEVLAQHRRPGLRPGARPVQPGDQRPAAEPGRRRRPPLRGPGPRAAQRGGRPGPRGGRRDGDDRDPADAPSRAHDLRVDQLQLALRPARRAAAAGPGRGPAHRHPRRAPDLEVFADSIAPEAACTSVQFHLQVSPDEFAPSGTPRSAWPRRRSPSGRTRRTSWGTSSGARPGSPCSPRPPTPDRWR